MKKWLSIVLCVLFAVSTLSLVACQKQESTTSDSGGYGSGEEASGYGGGEEAGGYGGGEKAGGGEEAGGYGGGEKEAGGYGN